MRYQLSNNVTPTFVDPTDVLFKRLLSAMFQWHSYGKETIAIPQRPRQMRFLRRCRRRRAG